MAKLRTEQKAVATEGTGTELVLVEKTAQIADFYKANSNARGSYRGGRKIGSWSTYDSGREAGNSARLSGSTNLPGARKEIA